jgi:hypothetical protein
MGGFFPGIAQDLFDLGLLVHHMLANFGIKLLDLHFARLIPLVFGCGVEMSSPGARDKFDFITHDSLLLRLDLFATGTHLGENRVNALLVDDAHSLGRETQANPAVFTLNPEPMRMQVGEKTSLGFVVRMGNVVSRNRALTGNLADF